MQWECEGCPAASRKWLGAAACWLALNVPWVFPRGTGADPHCPWPCDSLNPRPSCGHSSQPAEPLLYSRGGLWRALETLRSLEGHSGLKPRPCRASCPWTVLPEPSACHHRGAREPLARSALTGCLGGRSRKDKCSHCHLPHKPSDSCTLTHTHCHIHPLTCTHSDTHLYLQSHAHTLPSSMGCRLIPLSAGVPGVPASALTCPAARTALLVRKAPFNFGRSQGFHWDMSVAVTESSCKV